MRSRHCGELNRGLQNLGTPCEGERIVTFCGVQKVTKKHAGLRPATSIQSSIEKNFSRVFRRHEPKPVFRTKRRRKGFESVRKGYRSADARLMFFEKGLLYCKLTVGFCGWNLQLLVSFGVVRSWNFSMLKKAFLYRIALYELKKQPFSAYQKISIYRKHYALPSKASRFRNQNTACSNNFLLS